MSVTHRQPPPLQTRRSPAHKQYYATPALLSGCLLLSTAGATAETFSTSLPDRGWEQFSLSAGSGPTTLRAAFGDDLPVSAYARDWIAYTYDSAGGAYENPSLDGQILPGNGFWLMQSTGQPVTIDLSVPSRSSQAPLDDPATCAYRDCISLAVPSGRWAMIGNPFSASLAVEDLSALPCSGAAPCRLQDTADAFGTSLFRYDSRTDVYQELRGSDRLQPFHGAWIKAGADSDPALLIPDTDSLQAPVAAPDEACHVVYERLRPESVEPQPRVVVASTAAADIRAAVNSIKAARGGTLHFPAGRYLIGRDFGARTPLYFENIGELRITGEGADRTQLVLAADPALRGTQVKTLVVDGYQRLEIAHLALRGQKDFMNPATVPAIGEERWAKASPASADARLYEEAEQQSAIFLRNGNQSDSSSSYIHHVQFRHQGGDAINLAAVDNAVFSQLDIDDMGRNGITIGGVLGEHRSRNILIADNDFGAHIDTQLIDIELHGRLRDAPDGYRRENLNVNVQVIGNRARQQTPRDTIDLDQYFMDIHGTDGVVIEGNEFDRNRLAGSYAYGVVIQRNSNIGGGRLFRRFAGRLTDNSFDLSPQTCTHCTDHNAGLTFTETNSELLDAISLYGNVIRSTGVEFPVRIHNARQVNVVGNRFIADAAGREQTLRIEADMTSIDANIADNSGLGTPGQIASRGFSIRMSAEPRCQ